MLVTFEKCLWICLSGYSPIILYGPIYMYVVIVVKTPIAIIILRESQGGNPNWQGTNIFKFKNTLLLFRPYILEAKHLILLWIMKVKGPKNQADFIEVL